MSTVGFGDITPQTPLGRIVASALMLIGYSIIAVPTGIFTVELAKAMREDDATRSDKRGCPDCDLQGHDPTALHCRRCGAPLPATFG